jgi:hypothetical protein
VALGAEEEEFGMKDPLDEGQASQHSSTNATCGWADETLVYFSTPAHCNSATNIRFAEKFTTFAQKFTQG